MKKFVVIMFVMVIVCIGVVVGLVVYNNNSEPEQPTTSDEPIVSVEPTNEGTDPDVDASESPDAEETPAPTPDGSEDKPVESPDGEDLEPTNSPDGADPDNKVEEPIETTTPTPAPVVTPTPTPTPAVHTHDYSVSTSVDATCTTDGYTVYKCSCGASYTDEVKAKGHTWGDWVEQISPTTTSYGESRLYCTTCWIYQSKQIDMLPEDADDHATLRFEDYGNHRLYSTGDCYFDDYSTWDSNAQVSVYGYSGLLIQYTGIDGKRVEAIVEPIEGRIITYALFADGEAKQFNKPMPT